MPLLQNIPVRDDNQKCKRNRRQPDKKLKSKGDEPNCQKIINNAKEYSHRLTPCFSNIFRRSNNNAKQNPSIKEIPEEHLNNGKTFCADCERRRIKKLNRRRRSYVVQPVYVDNMQRGPVPFGHANDRAPLSQHNHKVMRKQDSNTSYELTSSDSEIGKTDQQKHLRRRQYFLEKFQKELRREYIKYENELSKNRVQQYPSKRDYNAPSPVYSTPHCQVMNAGTHENTGPVDIVPTNCSGFWEYIYDKVYGKPAEKEDSPCHCQNSLSPPGQSIYIPDNNYPFPPQPEELPCNEAKCEEIPECKSCIQQTEDLISDSLQKIQERNKKTNKPNAKCQCHLNKKRRKQKETSELPPMSMTQGDVTKPCQELHDDITRAVGEKYNGEILCIHNAPCILINGCINLPNAQDISLTQHTHNTQRDICPVTQDKKTSFYHICRKIKRPKFKQCEQACQYHQPSVEVQALQVKSEKIVQSICNHDPPCEVVYGCYKAKYDPKLENSCIHVPMCQRLPECRVAKRENESGLDKQCEHKPKCTEIPLCSRKFVVLTARGTVSTQVRPRTKLICRHEPPCIMIPKCLARIISDSYIPCDAIPDCVHQPCCDMIPACCRRAAKEMVSVSSQYPNACRIV